MPPRFAAVRLAVAVEPIVRATGTTVQRGGRFGQPFVRHEPPAYDNRNPYAPTLQRVRERESKAVQNEFDKAQRVGRNPKTGIEVPILPRRVMTFRASQSMRARVAGK